MTQEALTSSLLYLDGVRVSFDGFRALNGLSLVVGPGEMRAIIGPNGAGKTKMMDVITGKNAPDEGTVMFGGSVDLTNSTRPRSRTRHRPQVPEARRCSRTTRWRTMCASPEGRAEPVVGFVRRPATASRPSASSKLLEVARLVEHRPPARRRPLPRAEAMARDRHAARPGPEAPPRRRAGRG